MGQMERVQECSPVYTTYPSLAAYVFIVSVSVHGSIGCVCDVFLFEVLVLSGVHMAACMCDKPRAWGLLSSPQFSKLHKHLRETRAWAMGSPCWRSLELTVWRGASVRSCDFPRFHPRWRHQRCQLLKCRLSFTLGVGHYLWCVFLKAGDHAGFTSYLQ